MSTGSLLVVGVDCATQRNKTGLVLVSWSDDKLRLEEAILGSMRNDPAEVVTRWLSGSPNVLLALDAPLGWPRPLVLSLANHEAGQVLREDAERLFSRTTDLWIKERLQKQPLEVGANLIARTAHSALKLLDDVRRRTGLGVPLVWEPMSFRGVGAIEVYPAATRIALGIVKASDSGQGLSSHLKGDLSSIVGNPHVCDAAWCTVAGADFLSGRAEPPIDRSCQARGLDLDARSEALTRHPSPRVDRAAVANT
jgi:predicted nuclease with RNAse H fold